MTLCPEIRQPTAPLVVAISSPFTHNRARGTALIRERKIMLQEKAGRTEDERIVKTQFLIVKVGRNRPHFVLNPLILRFLC